MRWNISLATYERLLNFRPKVWPTCRNELSENDEGRVDGVGSVALPGVGSDSDGHVRLLLPGGASSARGPARRSAPSLSSALTRACLQSKGGRFFNRTGKEKDTLVNNSIVDPNTPLFTTGVIQFDFSGNKG